MEGILIGSYRIERELGRGGFGVVYVGVDTRLGRRAAIKQLLPELSSQREIVERFFNEAKAAASINHPGIVEIYDVGWHTDGSAYFAMKWLDGESLAKRLHHGALPPQVAATIARQVASALAAAHARGIVHRDLKPDNIVMVADDEVAIGERATVLDFGIAKLFGDQSLSQKTRTGMMMGTPSYMSPEQCRGAGEVDQRTDVYALGCILFEMLAGRPPFVAEGAGEILGMHQFVEAPDLAALRPDLPRELAAIVTRSLAKRPEERFAQMSDVQNALQPFAAGGRTSGQQAAPAVSSRFSANPSAHAAPSVANTPAHAAPTTLGQARGELSGTPARGRGGIILALLGVAAIGVAIAVVVATRPSKGDETSSAGSGAVAGPAAPAASGSPAPTTPADAAPASNNAAAATAARDRCNELERQRNWRALETCAKELPADANAGGRDLAEIARSETEAEAALAQLVAASDRRDYEAVVVAYKAIPSSSVYRSDATAALDKAGSELVRASVAQAKTAAAAKQCGKIEKLATQLDASAKKHAADKQDYQAALDAVRAVPCTSAKVGGTAQPVTAEVEAGESTPADTGRAVAVLVTEANTAAKAGQYGKALRVAKEALKLDPQNMQAVTAAAISACNLKSASDAKKYLAMLSGQRQGMVRQVCLRAGVAID